MIDVDHQIQNQFDASEAAYLEQQEPTDMQIALAAADARNAGDDCGNSRHLRIGCGCASCERARLKLAKSDLKNALQEIHDER